jgi:hypothetical protein
MGIIFNDAADDQVESLMKTSHLGQTWAIRYLKIKAIIWGTVATVTGVVATAVTDYLVFRWTDSSGIIGLILG